MKKDPKIHVAFILECIGLVEEYSKGLTETEFLNSTQQQDAIIRRVELIGEAVKNISPEVKDRYPEIPWKRIAGMRDILVHDYLGLDLEITWKVAQVEIPELKTKMLEVRRDLEAEDGFDLPIFASEGDA